MAVNSIWLWSSSTVAHESGSLRMTSVRSGDTLGERFEFTIYSPSVSSVPSDQTSKEVPPKALNQGLQQGSIEDEDDGTPESLALQFYRERISPNLTTEDRSNLIICKASNCALCRLLDSQWQRHGIPSFEMTGLRKSQEDSVSWKFQLGKVISKDENRRPSDENIDQLEGMFKMAIEEYEASHERLAKDFQGWLNGMMKLRLTPSDADYGNLVIHPLEECRKCHENCRRKGDTPLPKRVIDVGSGPRPMARLYEPMEGEIAPYITLSHCWGGEVPDKLLTTNISEYLEVLDVEKLPRTFADAVRLVQRLGFQYLWIDALCIQQDSFDEWEHEAAVMSEIYSNSLFTISGLDSVNSHTGLYSQFLEDSEWVDIGESMSAISIDSQDTKESQKLPRIEDSYKLNTRGWTLQERLMTPANLHFIKGSIVWECRTYCLYEDGSFKISDVFLKHLLTDLSGSRDAFGELDREQLWARLIENYCRRNLTNASDKLIAVAGLARTIQQLFPDKYYAGLWETDFPLSLLWAKVKDHVTRVSPYRAPTWSWASVDGAITFPITKMTKSEIWHPDYPRILSVNVIEHIKGSLGSVTEGYMEVEGIIHRLTSEQQSRCWEFMDTYVTPSICYALRIGAFSTLNAFSKECYLLLDQWGSVYKRCGAIPPERYHDPFQPIELLHGTRQYLRII